MLPYGPMVFLIYDFSLEKIITKFIIIIFD